MTLAELQRLFVESGFGTPSPALVAAVTGGGKLGAAEAVEVYRGAYPARLTEALGETFEACWRVLGDEDFLSACAEFARLVPSKSHNLSDYGRSFPGFLLVKHSAHAPFIGDLGRLEWEFKELFHKAPHHGLKADELAAKATASSRFALGTATALLRLEHRVLEIWRRDRKDETAITEKDWTGLQHVLLYKHDGNEVMTVEVDEPSYHVLTALSDGVTLEEALATAEDMDQARTTNLFQFMATNGLIERLS